MNRLYLFEKEFRNYEDDEEVPIVVFIDKNMYNLLKFNNRKTIGFEIKECKINVNYDDGIYIE